jgi:hypothetical protein
MVSAPKVRAVPHRSRPRVLLSKKHEDMPNPIIFGDPYQTAWTIATLRYGLSEDPGRLLRRFGRRRPPPSQGRFFTDGGPSSRGRSTASPDKSLVVVAVEEVPTPKNKKGKHGHACSASTASLPATLGSSYRRPAGAELGAFLTGDVAAGWQSPDRRVRRLCGRDAALNDLAQWSRTTASMPASSSRSSTPCSGASKPGSSVPITASAPSTQ